MDKCKVFVNLLLFITLPPRFNCKIPAIYV